ncbi:MAG: NAD(P)/FAD-dependent oxidoreductase [Desulfobacterium sp.]|nr:NAD(P)/FAD-dependent oxidoreductase [Desulfobacterium sp.]MBU3947087.1 NAD(P)/FAD-dependent oxidoreductase [Pseudomonadota bacterium]MBU4035393.1 NAD(P)/FAD-dependent oxidoreductase [Pseudomonadota bacterium]
MEKYYPVVIAGGGPAGSACAKALSDQGINALVLERQPLPRHKCCSGVLMGQTQELLKKYFGGLPPESVYCKPKIINSKNIIGWTEKDGYFVYEWEIPKDGKAFSSDFLNIWRNKFDHWLLTQSGAIVKERSSFAGFSIDDDKLKIDVKQGGTKTQLECSYLVGADGGDSLVRNAFDPSFKERLNDLVVYQVYYKCLDSGEFKEGSWNIFLGVIGDCLASIHKKDDLLTLVVGAFRMKGGLKGLMKDFEDLLSDRFKMKLSDKVRSEGTAMNDMFLRGDFCFGGGRVLLAGEAAGLFYLNGEGISVAIDSGYRAGSAIARAIKGKVSAYDLYSSEIDDIKRHVGLCASRQTLIMGPPQGGPA